MYFMLTNISLSNIIQFRLLLNASDTFRSTYIAKITYVCDMSIQTAKHKDSFPCEDK